jgi:putative addiction module component (TIGR02574 family)
VTLSESEFYEAGMALPPSVRKDIALRLLESLEVVDRDSVDEAWATEIGTRVDDVLSGKVQAIPGDDVFARIDERLDAREAARNA